MSLSIEEPVVVKPEIVSNNMSINDKFIFESKYGIVPYAEINIHDIPTAPKPCIVVSFLVGKIFFLIKNEKTNVDTRRITREFA
jgi:hypothetical protein